MTYFFIQKKQKDFYNKRYRLKKNLLNTIHFFQKYFYTNS